jgi:hypothetical protein
MTSISTHTKIEPVQYRGYWIRESLDIERLNGKYVFFPEAEGIQHDYDFDGFRNRYTGNCKWADSLEKAKDAILEKIMTEQPAYLVETKVKLGGFELKNITKFWWINDAIRFAALWNGTPLFTINSI